MGYSQSKINTLTAPSKTPAKSAHILCILPLLYFRDITYMYLALYNHLFLLKIIFSDVKHCFRHVLGMCYYAFF